MLEFTREVVKPSVWNLIERRITPLWVPDEQEDAILLKIQREEAEERERVKATPSYQIGDMDQVCRILINQDVTPSLDFGSIQQKTKAENEDQDKGLKRLIFVEMEEYAGFKENEPNVLPQQVQTVFVLDRVTTALRIRKKKPGLAKEWIDMFYSRESQHIFLDMFWWFFLQLFQKPPPDSHMYEFEQDKKEKCCAIFKRVASNYTLLLNRTFGYAKREKLLLLYPDAIAQAVYSAYCYAFPVSYPRYDTNFKVFVTETISLWMTGTKPMIQHFENWDYSALEPLNMRRDAIAREAKEKRKKKAKDKPLLAILNNISTFAISAPAPSASGTGSPRGTIIKCPTDNSHSSIISSKSLLHPQRHDSSKRNQSGQGSLTPMVPKPRKFKTKAFTPPESHPVEPGPEFELTKFNTNGNSPLVAYDLQAKAVPKNTGIVSLLSRREIVRRPDPDGITYYQEIRDSKRRVKDINNRAAETLREQRTLHRRYLKEHDLL